MSFLFLFIAVNLAFLGIMGVVMPDKTGDYGNLRIGAGLFLTATMWFAISLYFKLNEIHKTVKNDGKQTTNTPEGVRRQGATRLVSGRNDGMYENET